MDNKMVFFPTRQLGKISSLIYGILAWSMSLGVYMPFIDAGGRIYNGAYNIFTSIIFLVCLFGLNFVIYLHMRFNSFLSVLPEMPSFKQTFDAVFEGAKKGGLYFAFLATVKDLALGIVLAIFLGIVVRN